MLNKIVAVSWEHGASDVGRGAFPPHLSRCAERHDPSLGPFLLRVGLVYPSVGVVLLDTPVHWDREAGAIVLTAAQKTQLDTRLALAMGGGDRVEIPTARCGIAEQLTRPAFGAEVAALMGTDPRLVAAARAWVFRPARGGPPATDLPDAVAFHDIALPNSITLKIEPTTRCNFNCGFCYGRHLPQGDLALPAFEAVLDRLTGLQAVELTGEGEPLLNKDIYRFIRLCSDRGLFSHITTNGSALSDRNIDRLLDAGLRSLAVSMESLDPEKFARFRPGGDVEQVKAGIRRVGARARGVGANLTVSLWTTLMRDTLDEVPAFYAFAAEAGVDHFESFQTLSPLPMYRRFYDDHLNANFLEYQEICDLIAAPDTLPEVKEALRKAVAVYAQSSCSIFMDTVMVNWQGAVTPCCLLKTPDFPSLGNLRNESLETIWSRPEFELFRFALQHGIVLDSCRGCPDVAAARSGWKAHPC